MYENQNFITEYFKIRLVFLCIICVFGMYGEEMGIDHGYMFDKVIQAFYDCSLQITKSVRF